MESRISSLNLVPRRNQFNDLGFRVPAAKWALCIYLHVVHDGDLAVCTANWLDEQEGWQSFTMQAVSMLGDFVRLLVGYVRMMGNWLVFQLLMCAECYANL